MVIGLKCLSARKDKNRADPGMRASAISRSKGHAFLILRCLCLTCLDFKNGLRLQEPFESFSAYRQ